jgi:ABC-2 type transport system permease protein
MNWDQLKTIFWLRWQLTRNQLARGGGFGVVLAVIILFGAFVLGAGTFLGGLLGGAFGLGAAKASPLVVLAVWTAVTAAFLLFWMIGLMVELQRSESIDLQRLLHLPVALGQMFVINYLASHFTLSLVVALPAMLGLALGLVFARGAVMLLLLPLVLSMVFAITAWTYCLRGWLAAMMANPRRRRSIIMGLSLVVVLIAQLPNIYFNVIARARFRPVIVRNSDEAKRQAEERKAAEREQLELWLTVQKFVPPMWLAVGAGALAEGNPVPALLGTLGGCALGALGLRRAYRGTVRLYQGNTGGKAQPLATPAPAVSALPAKAVRPAGTSFLELPLPGVPEPAAALALANCRALLRAPEVKMALGMSVVVTLILAATLMLPHASDVPEAAKPFIATGALTFSIFMLVQFFANQFGYDRDGFRALVLSPTERRFILLGKNLACLPLGGLASGLLLGLMVLRIKLSPVMLLAAAFQWVAMLLLAVLAGNLLSILVPYRMQVGSMKPSKMPATTLLLMVLCQMLFPMVLLPVFLAPLAGLLWNWSGLPALVPVNLLLSLALALVMAFAYWKALGPLGRLLQRRETLILSKVSVEVE